MINARCTVLIRYDNGSRCSALYSATQSVNNALNFECCVSPYSESVGVALGCVTVHVIDALPALAPNRLVLLL